jgi:H+/Cl- antiporter ClcA
MPDVDVNATIRSKRFAVLLVFAAAVGLIVSLAAWAFLEVVHYAQVGIYTDLPKQLGYHNGAPLWWPLPMLVVAGLVTAFAIVRLPGRGGHVPADGLAGGATDPVDLPGILLAALATIGLGVVLGPEAPLIALGAGLGIICVRLVRRDAPPQLATVIAAAGTFAAVSMIFGSPLIAAVLMIEIAGLGGAQLKLLLLPGLLAAGIGSLVSIGMGSFTGLSTSAYALAPLTLPAFSRPTAAEFGWTILLAAAMAVGCFAVFRFARLLLPLLTTRRFIALPLAGLAIGGLAIAFDQSSGRSVNEVLFSGQDGLPALVANAGTWSLSALALLIAFKGVAWGISLAGFRGGPTFPALFLGAAGGIMASHLPGFSLTVGVGVGMAAAVVAVLELPLSAVVIGLLLTSKAGVGQSPLIIVGVVTAYAAKAVLAGIGSADRPAPEAERPAVPAEPRPTTLAAS